MSHLFMLVLFFVQSCAGYNYTYTWNTADVPTNTGWQSVACGSDGVNCVATQYYGDYNNYASNKFFHSSDSGATWKISSTSNLSLSKISSSKTGQYFVAKEGYFSSDYGASFALLDNYPNAVYDTALTQDAKTLYIVDNTTSFSVRKGVAKDDQPGAYSWTELSVPSTGTTFRSISCSGDGQTVIVADGSGSLYYSTDAGATFSLSAAVSAEGYVINQLLTSIDGSVSYITVYYKKTGGIFPLISRDSGATWNYTGLAAMLTTPDLSINGDGSIVAVSMHDSEGLWISFDYAENFELSEIYRYAGVGAAWLSEDGSMAIAASGEYDSNRGTWYLSVGSGVERLQQQNSEIDL